MTRKRFSYYHSPHDGIRMIPQDYFFVVDRIDRESGAVLKRALDVVPEIRKVTVWPARGIVEIRATRDIEESLKIACRVANVGFRAKTTKRAAAWR